MGTAETTSALSAQSVALGQKLADPEWLGVIRAQGAQAALALPLPDSHKQRPWKYLDVSGLDLAPYGPADAAGAPTTPPETGERSALVVQQEGVTVTSDVPNGLAVTSASDASPAARAKFGQIVAPNRSKFAGLHYALLSGAIVIDIAANQEVAGPVRIVRNYTTAQQLATPHTLIVTGANSRVEIIEDFTSSDEDIVVVPALEIAPGPGSVVSYTALHRWGAKTRVFAEQRTVTEQDAQVTIFNLVTGGLVVKGHIESSLTGRGSSSDLLGLSAGNASQHVDFYTLQDHIGADTRSDLLFKSALRDTSRAVYYGLTRVGLGAKNADANQENRNILLSKTAKADSDPVLEILTNDIIRASHGATVGPVDEEQLFYLETRGIPRRNAEAMLVRAFLGQVIGRVPEARREEFEAILDTKLEAH
jgi:Fe-S cluster assembly protein SufD